jgi:F-type H+-transporting ATPase subunit gamma
MSDTAQSLAKKIAGASDLQGVVRSMKALAASSISQYERAVASLDEYYRHEQGKQKAPDRRRRLRL